MGDLSFADALITKDISSGGDSSDDTYTLVGTPDPGGTIDGYIINPWAYLGDGGTITIGFENNALAFSGDSNPDLAVWGTPDPIFVIDPNTGQPSDPGLDSGELARVEIGTRDGRWLDLGNHAIFYEANTIDIDQFLGAWTAAGWHRQ